MKKYSTKLIAITALIFSAINFSSCSKEEAKPEPKPEKVFTISPSAVEVEYEKTATITLSNVEGAVSIIIPEEDKPYLSVAINGQNSLTLSVIKPYFASSTKKIRVLIKSGSKEQELVVSLVPSKAFAISSSAVEVEYEKPTTINLSNTYGEVSVVIPEEDKPYLEIKVNEQSSLTLTTLKPCFGSSAKKIQVLVKSGDQQQELVVNIVPSAVQSFEPHNFGIYKDGVSLMEVKYTSRRATSVFISSYQGGSPYQQYIKLNSLPKETEVNSEVSVTLTTKNINGYTDAEHTFEGIVSQKVGDNIVYVQLINSPNVVLIVSLMM